MPGQVLPEVEPVGDPHRAGRSGVVQERCGSNLQALMATCQSAVGSVSGAQSICGGANG